MRAGGEQAREWREDEVSWKVRGKEEKKSNERRTYVPIFALE